MLLSMNNKSKYSPTKQFVIKERDLPLSCSGPYLSGQKVSDPHPKIYLPIKENKTAVCPYCGTQYIFVI